MKKRVLQLLYAIALALALGVLYDIIPVEHKGIVLACVLGGIVLMAIIGAYWDDWVSAYRYQRWYNALPAHLQNDVDLYRATSSGYDGPDLFKYDTYGPDKPSVNKHIVV